MATVRVNLRVNVFWPNNYYEEEGKENRCCCGWKRSGIYRKWEEWLEGGRWKTKQELPWVETVLYLRSSACSKSLGSAVYSENWLLLEDIWQFSMWGPYVGVVLWNSASLAVKHEPRRWLLGVSLLDLLLTVPGNVPSNKVKGQFFSHVSFNWQLSSRSWIGCLGRCCKKGALTCGW